MKNASTDFSSSAARIATTTTSWSRLKGFEGNLSASKLNETIHRGRRDTPPFERNIRRAIILRHERNDFDKIRRRQNRLLIVHKRFPIFRKKKKKKISRYLGLQKSQGKIYPHVLLYRLFKIEDFSSQKIFTFSNRIENVGRSEISNITDEEEYFNPTLWQLCHV